MERTLTNYIRALRTAGAGVSTTEAIDAARALELVGYQDRGLLKMSLAAVLAKSQEEEVLHDRLFDLYFSYAETKPPRQSQSEEQEKGDDASEGSDSEGDNQGGQPSNGQKQPGSGQGGGGDQDKTGEAGEDAPLDLLELAQSGDATRMAMAMAQAGARADVDQIRFATQVPYFVRRMLEELGAERLDKQLMDALDERTEEGTARAEALIEARSTLMRNARAYAEARFEVFGRSASEAFMNEVMMDRALGALTKSDMERMKPIIAKMAKKLAAKHARRRKVRNRGQLDLRRTLRANAGNDGVPFDVIWKTKRKDKPKIVTICDVSGSVARYVRFLLLVLYALREKVTDLETFAFSSHLVDVNHDLEALPFDAAMDKILREVGNGSTDYGRAFTDLSLQYDSTIDKRTTVLILGDGRNNNGDPAMGVFQDIAAKAKRVIWLCPEHPASWGSGDSALLQYKPFCSSLTHCSTVADLEHALDDVLLAYG
jgi:uncharacterized protein with von Willebrand factor type A (vWA) domain